MVALAFAGFVIWYGPTLMGDAAYAVAAGESRAARDSLADLSKHESMSPLYRAINKAIKPAVVVVRVKQKIEMQMQNQDELFRRFFGENSPFGQMPRPGVPKKPSQAPKRQYFSRGLGSGMIVNARKGYVLTNWHVVNNADDVEVVTYDNRRLQVEWIRTDEATDLVLRPCNTEK